MTTKAIKKETGTTTENEELELIQEFMKNLPKPGYLVGLLEGFPEWAEKQMKMKADTSIVEDLEDAQLHVRDLVTESIQAEKQYKLLGEDMELLREQAAGTGDQNMNTLVQLERANELNNRLQEENQAITERNTSLTAELDESKTTRRSVDDAYMILRGKYDAIMEEINRPQDPDEEVDELMALMEKQNINLGNQGKKISQLEQRILELKAEIYDLWQNDLPTRRREE